MNTGLYHADNWTSVKLRMIRLSSTFLIGISCPLSGGVSPRIGTMQNIAASARKSGMSFLIIKNVLKVNNANLLCDVHKNLKNGSL